MSYAVAAIVLVLLGLFIGVPYVQAYRRRQELIRRGLLKRRATQDENNPFEKNHDRPPSGNSGNF